MRTTRKSIKILGLTAAGIVVAGGVAQAQVVNADVGVNPTFEQTAGAG
jgi:hypothetical protein